MPALCPLPSAISELFLQTSITGEITVADRYGLLAVLLQEPITDEEIYCVNRLLYAFRQGRVCMIDELSVIL